MRNFIVAALVAVVGVANSQPVESTGRDDHMNAKYVCQKFAARELKAPATARFEPLTSVAAVPSTDKKWSGMSPVWESMGWVDAQNSFGAMLRSEYLCTVRKVPPEKWLLLDMYWFKKPN